MPLVVTITNGEEEDARYVWTIIGVGKWLHIFEIHYKEPEYHQHWMITHKAFEKWQRRRLRAIHGTVIDILDTIPDNE